jgi:hypothetical protein
MLCVRRYGCAAGLLAACAAPACSSRIAHPPYVGQPTSALLEVSLPQPPGRVEEIPKRPTSKAVWVDGEWLWRRGHWAWLAGRWVEPPAGARFSPSAFVRGPDGRLWYAPGAWREVGGQTVAAPPTLAAATVDSVDVVDASGNTEATGPTIHR